MRKYAIKPFLVFVPAREGIRAHFRGGDDFIIPVEHVSDSRLLDAVIDVFEESELPLTPNEAASRLASRCRPDDVLSMVDALIQNGVMWEMPPADKYDFLWRYLSRFTSDVIAVKNALLRSNVYLWGGGEGEREIFDGLGRHALTPQNGDGPPESVPDFIVALGGFDTESLFSGINNYCITHHVPWMAASRIGPEQAQIGPIFIPEETACYQCFLMRMASNRQNYSDYLNFSTRRWGRSRSGLWHRAHSAIVGDIVALETVKFLSDVAPAMLVGKVRFVDLCSWETSTESVLKLPICPECGTPIEP